MTNRQSGDARLRESEGVMIPRSTAQEMGLIGEPEPAPPPGPRLPVDAEDVAIGFGISLGVVYAGFALGAALGALAGTCVLVFKLITGV